MKLPILVLLFWTALLPAMGQTGDPLEVFRTSVLPQYSPYFASATLSNKGQLILYANEKYHQLAINTRKALMGNLLKKWSASLVLVQDGSRSELWGLNEDSGGALRVDAWDINAPNLTPKETETPVKTALHPFFVYVGGQGMLDSEHNLNVAVNTRVGFFLLLNRWDLAFTFSGGIIGSIDSTAAMANQLSTGLMSRFYFPIQKLHISPNIGFDLEGTMYTTNEGVTSSSNSQHLLAGISWFVGHGSLDLGVRIGKEVTTTVGYTLRPDYNKRKKKK